MKLKGKVALVAGATGGIGRRVSMALTTAGVEVILVARNKKALNALKTDIQGKKGKANVYLANLTSVGSINKLAKKVKKKFNHIDLLFHCTGIGVYEKLPDIDIKKWQISLDLNVTTVLVLTQALLPLLEKSKKAYVFAMGSGMGKIGLSGRAPYCASKFALRGLMLSLAKEYEGTNINFVLFTLGSVMTAFGPLSIEEKREKERKGKRYLDPEWLAGHIVTKIKNNTLDEEVSIYPRHYYAESKKDKR